MRFSLLFGQQQLQVHELSSRVLQVESEKKQWQVKAETLEGDLKNASSQLGELKTKVAKTEAEKQKWESRAQEMEFVMSDASDVNQLQSQVARVEQEKKDLQNKAEVLEVQLATICDILKEHKPEVAEMFNNDNDEQAKAATGGGGGNRGAAGFVQSMFGNKAVLAVTMAAGIVAVVAGDYTAKHQHNAKRAAFVTNLDQVQDYEMTNPIPDRFAETVGFTSYPCFEFEEVEVAPVDEIVEQVQADELDDDLKAEMRALNRVVQGFKAGKDKIWGKLQDMRYAEINEDVFGLM